MALSFGPFLVRLYEVWATLTTVVSFGVSMIVMTASMRTIKKPSLAVTAYPPAGVSYEKKGPKQPNRVKRG